MRAQFGVTLIELIMSIVIVGIGIAGILMVFTTTVAKSADPMIQHQAIAVAEAYVEEIALRPFDDPDGVSGEVNRADFDDIFDYHGLGGAPANQFGTPVGLPDYTVTVSVVAAPAEGLGGLPGGDVARVDVTVTHTIGVSITLSTYRTAY